MSNLALKPFTTNPFPTPSALGSLEAYVQQVNRYPMLSAQQELELARRLREDNDLEAARTLILSHLRLVVAVARGYLGYGLPHGDLIQEGNVGLMKAVRHFDPERGVRLVSFAIHWIKAEIHEYILRNWRLVKIATTKAQRKLFFNLRSLKRAPGTLSSEEAGHIAEHLGVKRDEVLEMEMRLAGQDVALEGGADEDEDRFAPIAYLVDPAAEPSERLAADEITRLREQGLGRALAALDARSRDIVTRRWLDDDASATLHELAAEYGVSAERIRQIEAKAMQKMRAAMAGLD